MTLTLDQALGQLDVAAVAFQRIELEKPETVGAFKVYSLQGDRVALSPL